jgi:hypothetical protein
MATKEYLKEYRLKNKVKIARQRKEYRLKNKIIIGKRKQEYRLNNIDKIKIYNQRYLKEYYLKNKVKIARQRKEYYLKNKEKINRRQNEWQKKERCFNPTRRLNCLISGSVRISLKEKGFLKQDKTFKLLGYSGKELKNHLEKQFDQNMSWGNYGKYWQIDHVIPLSWFKTKNQIIKRAWDIKNLQPLERKLNAEKQDFYVGNPKSNINIIYLKGGEM